MKFFLILLCFIGNGLYAQSTKLDSLKNEIDNYKKVDTTLILKRISFFKKTAYESPLYTDLLKYSKETLELAKKIHFDRGIAITYQHIGVVYQYFKTDVINALENYQKALRIIDSNPKLKTLTPGSLNNIGAIYMNKKDYTKALEVYRRMCKEFENSETIPEQYLGLNFGHLKKLDSSIYYLKKAIHRAKVLNNPVILANNYSNLSKVLNDDHQPQEARENIELALGLIEKHKISLILAPVYTNASLVYIANENYDLAEKYAKEALKLPELENHLPQKSAIYETLYTIYKEKKNYKSALKAHEQFKFFNDSLIAVDERIEFTKKELKFQSDRKQLLAQAEISKQKFINRLYLVIGGFVFFSLILLLLLLYQKKKSTEAGLKINLIQSKLTALKAQLNPHFIFNALSSIEQYMLTHNAKEASSYLIKFSSLMREVLQNSEKNRIFLSEEIKLMKTYIEVESLRLKFPINLNVQIDENIDPENTLVPSLFIQPFIENSIEHGISKKNEQGNIKIIAKKTEDMELICIVEDDGVGRKEKESTININHKSMGVEIAKERIDYINQLTNNKAFFKIDDLEQGVRVIITIPYITKF